MYSVIVCTSVWKVCLLDSGVRRNDDVILDR